MLSPHEKRVLYLCKRHGPQDIDKNQGTLAKVAGKLVKEGLARFNCAGRLEYIATEAPAGPCGAIAYLP